MATQQQGARPFEVIIWGASGFAGKPVCQHIAKDYQGFAPAERLEELGNDAGKVRWEWAMAGRDKAKLEQVRSMLTVINEACQDVPILTADAHDVPALGRILSQTQAIIAMAGPYCKYGNTVLEQCVEQGTHCCDITGSYVQHNQAAQGKGVKLVHCCVYDRVPSDLGTFMMVDYIKTQLGKKTAQVTTLVGDSRGGVSGGTIATGMALAAPGSASELSASSTDPYYLAKLAGGRGSDMRSSPSPALVKAAGTWAAPFIMEAVNSRVVHFSNALQPERYGTDFKYTDLLKTGSGWFGWTAAMAITGALMTAKFALRLSVLRDLAVRRDPGYLGTSRIVLEAGRCLAQDTDKLSACELPQGGVMTPAAAMDMVLVDRLRAAGMEWKVAAVGEGWQREKPQGETLVKADVAKKVPSEVKAEGPSDGGESVPT